MDRLKELMIITIQKRNYKRTVGAFAPLEKENLHETK